MSFTAKCERLRRATGDGRRRGGHIHSSFEAPIALASQTKAIPVSQFIVTGTNEEGMYAGL